MENNLFNQLYNASEYYRITNGYNEIIRRYRVDINNCKEKYAKVKNKKDSPLTINLAAISIFSFLFLFGLPLVINDNPFIVKFIGLLIWVISALGIIVIPVINTIRCKKSVSKYAKKADELWYKELGPIVAENEKNINKAISELQKFKKDNCDCISFLPESYQNYKATAYMALAVGQMRADTFKEAANLYEEQLHRWRLEEINEEIAYQKMAINNNLSEIYDQQVQTNKRLRSIETLEFYNMWYK